MIEIFKNDKDQSQFEKALEEAKKQMSEIRFSTHVS